MSLSYICFTKRQLPNTLRVKCRGSNQLRNMFYGYSQVNVLEYIKDHPSACRDKISRLSTIILKSVRVELLKNN